MKKLNLIMILAAILFAASCKKNSPNDNSGILEDGPLSSKLGKRIRLNEYGIARSYFWGRNSNELFITAETKLLQLNLTTQDIKVLESSGGLYTGKTNENNGIIFVGTLNGNMGYYEYTFSTDAISGLVPLSKTSASNLFIAGNTMIFYTGTSIPSSNPCANLNPWDFCWQPSSNISSFSLYHVDKLTRSLTLLPYKTFMQFSRDGSMTIFYDNVNVTNLPVYLFDNATRQFTDSFTISTQYSTASYIKSYFDNVFKSYYINSGKEVVVVNARTNQEMDRYSLNVVSVQLIAIYPSTEVFVYVGTPAANSNSRILGIYDMKSKQNRTIADLSADESALLSDLIPTDDNKKLLIRYLNDLYIKEIY